MHIVHMKMEGCAQLKADCSDTREPRDCLIWQTLYYRSETFSALRSQDVSTSIAPQASHALQELRDKIPDAKVNIRIVHIKFQNKGFMRTTIPKRTHRDKHFTVCKNSSTKLVALNIRGL